MKVNIISDYSFDIKIDKTISKTYIETLELDFKDYLEDYFKDKEKITRDDLINSVEAYIYNLDKCLIDPDDEKKEIDDISHYVDNMDEIVENYKYFINYFEYECKHENQDGNYCSKCGVKLK